MWTLLASVALATTPTDVPDPRPSGGWVTDAADILDETAEAELNTRIEALHRDLHVEIAVVTLQEVDRTPKEFATALFNHWTIGDAKANNGLLVLMVMGQRRLEMETGYGLEPLLTDSWLGAMQQQKMVPEFKAGNFGTGLVAGLVACDERLRQHPAEAMLGTQAAAVKLPDWPTEPTWEAGSPIDPLLAGELSFGGALALLALGGAWGWRRRQRTCPDCHVYMPMLDEEADDAHLSEGQRMEETVGSVDHQVHACPTCDRVVLFRKRRWFSGYSTCPKCSHRTCTTSKSVLESPTYHSTGRGQTTTTCAGCGYSESHTYSIARLVDTSTSSSSSSSWSSGSSSSSSSWSSGSSSSSGSSGGSWGGGHSGGGGAGSSW
ncbi:MAG: TPM domain-containing protein [Myxococcales bacterium]|nr:TPM domain-containing protein [Myxococcales bacterium]